MPINGKKITRTVGSNTIASPEEFGLTAGVDRFNPTAKKDGGPAMRKPGHKLGMTDVPGKSRMNPKIPKGGGPAMRDVGHRLGQVKDINPAIRFKPPTKG
jgi:hypothetical protein